jgi:hypothetical protein
MPKMHLKEPAKLKTPKEGNIKGRKKRERRENRKKTTLTLVHAETC